MSEYAPEVIAQVTHAAMMILQQAQKDPSPSPPWMFCTAEVRANAIAGVIAVREGMTPEENHERWRTQLLGQGWRAGLAKDPYARTHPSLVPWRELRKSEQDRNRLFAAIVLALTNGECPCSSGQTSPTPSSETSPSAPSPGEPA